MSLLYVAKSCLSAFWFSSKCLFVTLQKAFLNHLHHVDPKTFWKMLKSLHYHYSALTHPLPLLNPPVCLSVYLCTRNQVYNLITSLDYRSWQRGYQQVVLYCLAVVYPLYIGDSYSKVLPAGS